MQSELWKRTKVWKINNAAHLQHVYIACKQIVFIVWTGGGVEKSMQELWPVQECECLCKRHKRHKKGIWKWEIQENRRLWRECKNMCLNLCTVCVCVCVFACARQWPAGMEGIPCSFQRGRRDFGEGEQVAGCHGVTVKARPQRRDKFYTTSTFHTCSVCESLLWFCFVVMWNLLLFQRTTSTRETTEKYYFCLLVFVRVCVCEWVSMCQRLPLTKMHFQNPQTHTHRHTENTKEYTLKWTQTHSHSFLSLWNKWRH